MHNGNLEWLAAVRLAHPAAFDGARILEIGSMNWNGSARKVFTQAALYVGVDQAAGPAVDVVSSATKTQFFDGEFDALLCLSVFEHDPDWRAIMPHNLKWVKRDGLVVLCFGAEGNLRHPPDPWAPVPVADFAEAALSWPVKIIDAFFEGERFTPDCPGCYDVLAVKL